MRKALIYAVISFVFLFFIQGAQSAQKYALNLEKVSFDLLGRAQLQLEIIQHKKAYALAPESEKSKWEFKLGYLFFLLENYDQATSFFEKTAQDKGFSFNDYGLSFRGRIALAKKDCNKTAAIKAELEKNHIDSPATGLLIKAWRESSCAPKKITHPKTRKARIQKLKKDLYEHAVDSFDEKNYRAAIFQFNKYLNRVSPNHPQVESALIKLSVIYKRLRKHSDYLRTLTVLSKYKKAGKEFPYNPRWIYEIARFHWNRERISLANKKLNQLIRWPYHAYVGRSYFILGKIEAENQRYQGAINYFIKSTEYIVDPALQEEIAYLISWYHYKLGHFKEAADNFSAYRKNFPNSDFFDRATYWLGRSALKLNQHNLAESTFLELVNRTPYSYYGILSTKRLNKKRKLHPLKKRLTFKFSNDVFDIVNKQKLERARSLINLRIGEAGITELKQSVPFNRIAKTPPLFQYYMATLYGLGGDHISSFIILNGLHKDEETFATLPKEHLNILYPKRYWDLIMKYSEQYKMDPYIVLSIMRQESAFHAEAISPADAYGLLQMTPYMGRAMGKALSLPLKSKNDLLVPEKNLNYSTYYLSTLFKKYKNNLVYVLIAYNANDRALKKWRKRYGVPDIEEFIEEIPYQETRAYVKLIYRNYTNNFYVHEGTFKTYPL